jgi:transcriptional regulator with XRE-family HTH domain
MSSDRQDEEDLLRRLRRSRRLTQGDVAEQLVRLAWLRDGVHVGVNADMVSKWERGEKRPSRLYSELLAILYDTDVRSNPPIIRPAGIEVRPDHGETEFLESLTEAAGVLHELGPAGEIVRGRVFDGWRDEFVRRRSFLKLVGIAQTAITLAAPAATTRTPGQGVGTATFDALDTLATRYRTLYHSVPPSALLSAVVAHLDITADLLRSGLPARSRRRVLRNRSEVATLAGRLSFFDLKDTMGARSYYHAAVEAAREVPDHLLAAAAWGHTTFVAARDGNLGAASDYLNSARSLLARTPRTPIASWLSAVEAEIYVQSGDPQQALVAIDHAECQLHTNAGMTAPGWFDYYDAARLEGFKGYVLLHTGLAAEARRSLAAAFDELPPRAVKQRSVYLADLATAHLHDGEVEEACRVAGQAASTLGRTGYATAGRRLREFRTMVDPWKYHPAVRAFDTQLAGR